MRTAHDDDVQVLNAIGLEAVHGKVRLIGLTSRTGLPERLVDRALQRLRKNGKARYSSEFGWRVLTEKG